jgi:hypothetical protein
MAILSDDELQQWIDRETRAGSLQPTFEAGFFPSEADLEDFWELASDEYESPTGRIYKKHRPYSHRPNWLADTQFYKVFFYYFAINSENSSVISRVFSTELKNISGDWQNKICEWIKISREHRLPDIPSHSDDFSSANPNTECWDAASHIVVFFDSKDWEYIEGEYQGKHRNFSLHFSTDNRKERNRSFFDARTEELASGDKILVVDNHHVCARFPRRRRREGDAPDDYKFDIYYEIAVDDGSGDHLMMIIDPSSRNTGP